MINRLKSLTEISVESGKDPDEKSISISQKEAQELIDQVDKFSIIKKHFDEAGINIEVLKMICQGDFHALYYFLVRIKEVKLLPVLEHMGFMKDPQYIPDHYTCHHVNDMDESMVQNCIFCGETIIDYRETMVLEGSEPIKGFAAGDIYIRAGFPKILLPEPPDRTCTHSKCNEEK